MGKDSALIPVEDGKYDYAWVDPNDPRAREVKSIEVVERVGEVGGPTGAGENLLIIGDSGDALRSLGTIPEYADTYLGQVKLVYIDPPFNTGQTFEHYADQMEHSIWLTMMRDRIRDIKPLLADDASIWVHLDDAEVHRMRVLLDEEFGADRCASQIVWQKRTTRENRSAFSDNHDHILVYTNCPVTEWRETRNRLPRTEATNNPDNDPRGPWDSIPFTAQGFRANQMYSITTPTGVEHQPPANRCWGAVESEYQRLLSDGRIYFPKGGNGKPRIKQFASEAPGLVPQTIWPSVEVGENDEAKREIQSLFPGQSPFDTPKPERLLSRIVHIGSNPGDLIVDFFGGSGTTAAVAHKMGWRWLTVELAETNACLFTVPRLRRVVEGQDPGGVTSSTTRVAVADLPDGVGPEDARKFTTLVGKFTDDRDLLINVVTETAKFVRQAAKTDEPPLREDESKALLALLRKVGQGAEGEVAVDVMPQVRKALRDAAKTRDESTTVWEGGGGFTVAKMGPSMYEVDDEDGQVFLSSEATNGAWSKAIAGQLKFALTPDDPVFCGVRKRQRLAVIDGVADEMVVRTVAERLGEKERAVIVAKGVVPEAAQLLQELSPGSRIKKAPADVFPKATVK
ncbi:site-specific DNA-methyltransferase [Nostocoides veronense]|uniref:DNA methylase N-4/N-6 domain-containing protein n=1 Tax=Nostocoides veronense TaxID=330836 RepID=A0ABN2LE46_9MICO